MLPGPNSTNDHCFVVYGTPLVASKELPKLNATVTDPLYHTRPLT